MQKLLYDRYIIDSEKLTIFSLNFNKNIKYSDQKWVLKVKLFDGEKYKNLAVSRIFYENFIGEIPENHVVSYKDKNYKNLSLDNLLIKSKKESVSSKRRVFSNLEIEKVISLYASKNNSTVIAKKIKTTPATVIKILRENNIRIRTGRDTDLLPYRLNDNFFKEINSEYTAYILGFLYADGDVSRFSNRISIGINDLDLLTKIQKIFEINKDIYKNPNHNKNYTLCFSSREMKSDLIRFGCIPAKSLILKFPTKEQVPDHLIHHFIRGYFDGDGCISGKIPSLKFISSRFFCEGLKEYLEQNFNIKCGKISRDKHHNQNTGYFKITGIQNIKNMGEIMYKNATIYLNRKKERFEKL